MLTRAAIPPGTPRHLSRLEQSSDSLAKQWLLKLVEGTAFNELEDLSVEWVVRDGPRMIAEIVQELTADRDPAGRHDPSAVARARSEEVLTLRRGDVAAVEVTRDIAALHALIVQALQREPPDHDPDAFAESIDRLADIFADINAAVTETLARAQATKTKRDLLTGLPGDGELHNWLTALTADSERYGRPFALLGIDVDGLKRISAAYGKRAGDAMLVAVGRLLRDETRAVDRVFRMRHDDFCVLAPNQEAAHVRPLARRLRRLVEISQAESDPRVAVSIGVVSCPRHGSDPTAILDAATEARHAARASGEGIAVTG